MRPRVRTPATDQFLIPRSFAQRQSGVIQKIIFEKKMETHTNKLLSNPCKKLRLRFRQRKQEAEHSAIGNY